MVVAGAALVLGSVAVSWGPVALVCGVLLLWSGIVKMVVLRIWQGTLPFDRSSGDGSFNDGTRTTTGPPL
jgi:uncharacterized protein involved in response to NO